MKLTDLMPGNDDGYEDYDSPRYWANKRAAEKAEMELAAEMELTDDERRLELYGALNCKVCGRKYVLYSPNGYRCPPCQANGINVY